jgi:hypothetical protein
MWAYLCGEYGVLAYPFAFGIGFAGGAAAEDSGSNACDAGTIIWVNDMENKLDTALVSLLNQIKNLEVPYRNRSALNKLTQTTLDNENIKNHIIADGSYKTLQTIALIGVNKQNYQAVYKILYNAITHENEKNSNNIDISLRNALDQKYEHFDTDDIIDSNEIFENTTNYFQNNYIKADELKIELENLIDKTKQTLNEERSRISELKQSLYEIRDGSYSEIQAAFDKLEFEKNKNISKYRKAIYTTGCATLVAPILEIILSIVTICTTEADLKTWTDFLENIILPNISIQVPIFAIFILSIYFFRIALNEYLSEKNELLQIQTRAAICKFTPAFLAFGKGNEELLKEFKQYIYSPISTKECPTPLPTDSFTELVKSLKDIIPKIK